jgi:hypothetical protein
MSSSTSNRAGAGQGGRPQPTRGRQMTYALGIVVLFGVMIPYSFLLSHQKDKYDLGEAKIGQIDSGSFLYKIAQLAGFRGVAANILWSKALDLQKANDWDRLRTTVDFITQLQPHFLRVWSFQGWNLAYNVSVEWDAPEDKYTWIKEGIKFLQKGVKKNVQSADLIWDTAWTSYHKIGFADEAIVLRRLFHDDDEDFRTYVTPSGDRVACDDNFLFAHGWFAKAVKRSDDGGNRIETNIENPVEYVDHEEDRKGRPGDLAFRSMPAHALIRYAAALEKASMQGRAPVFGERARSEWRKAYNGWLEFGKHPFPMFRYENEATVRLDDLTVPARYDALDKKGQYWTDRWGQQMHYPFWKDRCAAEMEPEGTEARRFFYEGTKALKSANFVESVEKYRQGLDLWDKLLKRHPIYRDDDLNQRDTGMVVKRYLKALTNAGRERPKHIPFEGLLKGVEFDTTPDPFDELDMPTAPLKPAGSPAPAGPR